MEPLIKLKVEWEALGPTPSGSASIPFLDIRIHRSLLGFSYSVYRKPTATDMYTHCYSAHPMNTKRGVLIGLFLRALRLCSPEHLETETDHITQSFRRLKYPNFMIQQALSTAKSRFYNPVVRERPKSKYHLQLPCHPGMQALRPALANIGVSTSLSSSNTLRSHLSRTGPRAPAVSDLPGVYQVNCQQCPDGEGTYYGETGNSLLSRMSSHQRSITDEDTRSSVYIHMRDNPGHSFNLDEPTMIYASNNEFKRKLVESSLIATRANLNLRPGDFPVCKLTAPVVLHALNLNAKLTAPSSSSYTSHLPSSSNPAPPAPHVNPSSARAPSTSQPSPPAPSTPPSARSPSPVMPTAPIPLAPADSSPSSTSPHRALIHPTTSAASITPSRLLHDEYVPSPVGPVFCRTRRGRNAHRIAYRSRVAPYQTHSSQTITTAIQSPVDPSPVSSSAPLPVLPPSTYASPSIFSAPTQPTPSRIKTSAPESDIVPSPVGPVFRRTRQGRTLHRIALRHQIAPYAPSTALVPVPVDVAISKPQCRKRGRPPKK